MTSGGDPGRRLGWPSCTVRGRPVSYLSAGDGPPLLFLHGWGLSHASYRGTLRRLVDHGMRVLAPALPGFGGTPDLPADELSLAGYARWTGDFLDAVGVAEPVTLVGHSFGGGVAIRIAHDGPHRVSRLVLVNSIGGSAWTDGTGVLRAMRERPMWDWGLHLRADVLPLRRLTRVLPVIMDDAVGNLLRNPLAIWRVANLARTADLRAELEVLKRRRLPVVVIWGRRDRVIPAASMAALSAALGDPGVVTVDGNHSWLLSDPRAFVEVITNVLQPGVADPGEDAGPATGCSA
ncbi:alpha/beta fold hydrolase [Pseudonocardia acidicola]|uniref:Alpha/beta fold hydrolase n=1 Tax=Pseudonocardia acidicola TaxID=2724939 RepID=A0ABX1S7Y0_9PSEU|nr:alpha/beta fold hydrolase [Pseudonocardia acidicola]NMH97019.1 alpha/beta fold hydrolase [Pseudonocardia acidicola]